MSSEKRFTSSNVDSLVPLFYKIFTLLDLDKDEHLDGSELKRLLKILNKEISNEDLQYLIRHIKHSQSSSDGQSINFSEFLHWIRRSLQSGLKESHLTGIFEVLDANKDGKVSPAEVVNLGQKLGLQIESNEAQVMLGGDVDFAGFFSVVSKAFPLP